MSTFKVDKEQVDNSVEALRKLLEECEEAYTKEIPESTVDKGQTHNELSDLCNNIKTTCYYLGELINNTILFLGQSSEMFDTSDRKSADVISVDSNDWVADAKEFFRKTSAGFSAVSAKIEYNDKQATLMENMLANNQRVDTSKYSRSTYYDYYDSNGVYRSNWGVYYNTDGCTWYAYNRYQEMNPNTGSMFAGDGGGGNANNWVNSIDKNKFNVSSTSDTSVIQCNSIAVSTEKDAWEPGQRASGNHVVYIEAVKDGYVYYTDGSYGSPESSYGYVQKVPVDVFARDYEYVITAK